MSDTETTLVGGQRLEVTLRNGSKENAFVRELPIRLFPEYIEAIDDEVALAKLYLGKPAEDDESDEYIDSLTVASHEEILKLGKEVNAPFFTKWIHRRIEKLEKIGSDAKAKEGAVALRNLLLIFAHEPAQAGVPS